MPLPGQNGTQGVQTGRGITGQGHGCTHQGFSLFQFLSGHGVRPCQIVTNHGIGWVFDPDFFPYFGGSVEVPFIHAKVGLESLERFLFVILL